MDKRKKSAEECSPEAKRVDDEQQLNIEIEKKTPALEYSLNLKKKMEKMLPDKTEKKVSGRKKVTGKTKSWQCRGCKNFYNSNDDFRKCLNCTYNKAWCVKYCFENHECVPRKQQ